MVTGRSKAFVASLVVNVCIALVWGATASAQIRRPKADVMAIVEPATRSGTNARVAIKVALPEGLHTQSNKPRDPNLIPTELTIDAPAGIQVKEIVWPPATDLKQLGQDQPLAVFEREFLVGVQLAIPASTPPGALRVPGHLRYQACDANLCYAPATADFEWAINVVPATSAPEAPGTSDAANESVKALASIRFGTGESGGSGGAGGTGGAGCKGRSRVSSGYGG